MNECPTPTIDPTQLTQPQKHHVYPYWSQQFTLHFKVCIQHKASGWGTEVQIFHIMNVKYARTQNSVHYTATDAATVQKRSSLSNQSNNDGKLSQISSQFHRNNSDWSKFWSLVCSKNPTDGEMSDCDKTKSWLANFGNSSKRKQQLSYLFI